MNIVGKTDKGIIRQQNEDALDFGSFDDGVSWALVCDGMGGVHGGRMASTIATETIADKIKKCYSKQMPVASLENLLLSSITTANVMVYDRGSVDEDLHGMGTTVVAAIVKNNEACIAHVGDSRAYKISGDEISLITKDHSLVQEMLDLGQITQSEFENHPRKNIITRALGIRPEVCIDYIEANFSYGDVLLVCTDGLTNCVSTGDIVKIVHENRGEDMTNKLVDKAKEGGGTDNITVTVVY